MQPAAVIGLIMSAINKKKHVSTHLHDGKHTHYVQVLLKIIDVYKFHGHLGNVFSGNGHMETPARETAARTTSRWHVTVLTYCSLTRSQLFPGGSCTFYVCIKTEEAAFTLSRKQMFGSNFTLAVNWGRVVLCRPISSN